MTITVLNPEKLPEAKRKLMKYLVEDMLEKQAKEMKK